MTGSAAGGGAPATSASLLPDDFEPPEGIAMVEVDGRVLMEPIQAEVDDPVAGDAPDDGRWEEPLPGAVVAGLGQHLAPFGDWFDSAIYGRVWRPSPAAVGALFTPFVTGGRWVRAGAGYAFESRWEWGSVVFNFGRWVRDPDIGWAWIPSPVRVVFGPRTRQVPARRTLHIVRLVHPPGIEFSDARVDRRQYDQMPEGYGPPPGWDGGLSGQPGANAGPQPAGYRGGGLPPAARGASGAGGRGGMGAGGYGPAPRQDPRARAQAGPRARSWPH